MLSPTRLTGVCLAAVVALTACSGEGDQPAAGGETSPAAAPSPYLPVPEGVELTAQGSELSVGDSAVVAYEPRQNAVGVLDIRVTSMEKASFALFEGWDISAETRQGAPYFVRASVENVGDTDLGGRPVPLYIVDGENRLIESSVITGSYDPCPGSMFPKRFRSGDRVRACMVYFAPDKGDLTAVSFRPDQEFDPIVWTGELKQAGPSRGKKQRDGDKR